MYVRYAYELWKNIWGEAQPLRHPVSEFLNKRIKFIIEIFIYRVCSIASFHMRWLHQVCIVRPRVSTHNSISLECQPKNSFSTDKDSSRSESLSAKEWNKEDNKAILDAPLLFGLLLFLSLHTLLFVLLHGSNWIHNPIISHRIIVSSVSYSDISFTPAFKGTFSGFYWTFVFRNYSLARSLSTLSKLRSRLFWKRKAILLFPLWLWSNWRLEISCHFLLLANFIAFILRIKCI